jgi:RNA polymerase sigma-70 factor (ECF subfamily)
LNPQDPEACNLSLEKLSFYQNKKTGLNYEATHKTVVERCRKGDSKAQFELYELYARAMYNLCLRMVKHEADAEDVLQNAFIDVFRKLDSFRFESSVGAWIKRIVVNNCVNFLKKRRFELTELNEEITGEKTEPELSSKETDYDIQAINQAIFKLPQGYRIIFSLYLLEGYDHEEIADILNISVSTSKSQYSRAKKKLRELLQEQPLAMD